MSPPASVDRRPPPPDHVPGEVLVRFAPGSSAAERAAVRAEVGAGFERRMLLPGAQVLGLPGRSGGEREAVERLERSKDVLWAQLNHLSQSSATFPHDELFGALWGLHNVGQAGGVPDADIDAPEAWDTQTGSPAVVVAVVDQGVALDHPDLAPNLWSNDGEIAGNGRDDDGNGVVDDVAGADFADLDADPTDVGGHGTHVAGTIAASGHNGIGVTGVAWRTRIMPVRVIGTLGGTDEVVANGFAYAGRMGARVVNASFGRPGTPEAAPAMVDAVEAFPSTLFVVAAGNGGTDNDGPVGHVPCGIPAPNLICVAATGPSDELAGFSNVGARSVDLGAPGSGIRSTYVGGSYATLDGTSMAAPHVAGVAALLFASVPAAPLAVVRDALLDSGDPVGSLAGRTVTGRRLNARQALDAVGATAPPPPPPPPPPPQPSGPQPSAPPAPGSGPSPPPKGPAPGRAGGTVVLPVVTTTVSASWSVRRGRTRVDWLTVEDVPRAGSARVTCRGRGCPLRRRTFRPRGWRLDLFPWFRAARLRTGTVVAIRIAAPGMTGKVVRFRTRRGRVPTRRVRCLLTGRARPVRCQGS